MQLQILRLTRNRRGKTSSYLHPSVCRSSDLLFGCVWSGCLVLEIICLICFVCQVMLNVPFREFKKNKNNKQVRGAVITGSECHKGRRERVTDSAVIKQASTMFKPLNIDLPHSAGCEGLKFCKCI